MSERLEPHVYLDELVFLLERTAKGAVQAVTACEILLATDGLPLE